MDAHPTPPRMLAHQDTSRSDLNLARCRRAFVAASLTISAPCAWAHTSPSPSTTVTTPPVQTSTPAPSSAPPPVAQPAAAAADPNRYIIGADDMLQITVWHEPSMSGALPVRPDGMISLALLNDVPAAGKTPMQLSDDITEKLKKLIRDPSVTVVVTAVNSKKVFLVGEVGKVGPIPLTPGMSPLQAIATAGGPTAYANLKHIYVLRGAGAKQQKIAFNYKQALKGDNRQGIELLPGDTIVVP